MQYDLALLADQCSKFGWVSTLKGADQLGVSLEPETTLLFANLHEEGEDTFIGFEGFTWHTHGGLMFSDPRGFYIELEYTDVLPGLADKSLLVCELWVRGALSDRWLTHRDYVSDLKHMQDGDEVRIRPIHAPRSGA